MASSAVGDEAGGGAGTPGADRPGITSRPAKTGVPRFSESARRQVALAGQVGAIHPDVSAGRYRTLPDERLAPRSGRLIALVRHRPLTWGGGDGNRGFPRVLVDRVEAFGDLARLRVAFSASAQAQRGADRPMEFLHLRDIGRSK